MHFLKCTRCDGGLLMSNRYCPCCGLKNEKAVGKQLDLNLQIAFGAYPEDKEAFFREGPCPPAKHANIVANLKAVARASEEVQKIFELMNFCSDCGQKLPK